MFLDYINILGLIVNKIKLDYTATYNDKRIFILTSYYFCIWTPINCNCNLNEAIFESSH